MNTAEVGIFEETGQIRLACLLQGEDGASLETQVRLEVLGDLTHQTLNGSLRISSSVLFWYLRISRSATVPGRKR